MSKYDVAIYIGRFQPLHNGHLHVLEKCGRIAEHTLVLVGSSDRPRTVKNPFTYNERAGMLLAVEQEMDLNICPAPLNDFLYREDLWVQEIHDIVQEFVADNLPDDEPRIALVGHFKDSSSEYLRLFPEWDLVEVENYQGVNATDIRESLLTPDLDFNAWREGNIAAHVPMEVIRHIEAVSLASDSLTVEEFLRPLSEEKTFIDKYKKAWESAPYAPTFVTADAVILHQNKVLLVERGGMPGKGLLALPGGFLDQNETLIECAIREAFEETGIKLNKAWSFSSKVFDLPGRSTRGRTITHAFGFYVPNTECLPTLSAGDDAANIKWVPIHALSSREMYEDHYDILKEIWGYL